MKKMSINISFILLIIFVGYAFGLESFNTTKWNEIKKESPKYHNTLLNDEIITDLKECYKYNTTAQNYEFGVVCSNYFDLVLQINKTESIIPIITPDKIKTELDKPVNSTINNINNFCDRVTHSIPDNKLFADYDMCRISCVTIKNEMQLKKTLRPLCKIIDFMAILLTTNTTKTPVEKHTDQITQNTNIPQPNILINNNEKEHVQANNKKETISTSTDENVLKIENKLKLEIPGKTVVQTTKNDDNKSISNQPNIVSPKSSVIQKVPPPPPLVVITKKDEIKENSSPINVNINEKLNQLNEDTNLDINNGNIDDTDIEEDKLMSSNYYAQDGEEDKIKGSVQSPIQNNKQNNINNDIKLQQNPETFDKFNDIKNEIIKNGQKNILNDPFYEKSGSNFFTYLLIAMFGCILLYVAYHNKTKILALLLEGRRGQKGRVGRRKHTAAYRKLDSNLEEAISSPSSARSSQIIY